MKKFLITLVLCLFSLSVFSSCSFLSDKMGVMERISRAMDKVDSYESVGELSITAYYDNKKMYIKGDTKQIFSKEKDSGLYFYCSDTVDIEYNSTNTSTTVVEAYNDGEYFFSHTLNNVGNKLRSSHTEEEFLEYYEKVSESGDLLSGYSELTSVKNDDGKYEISLSEYNGEKIRDINLIYGFPLDDGGASIENINVSILANAEYLVEEINVEYVFSDALYSGEQKVVFSNYGSAEKKMSVVNPKIYTAVEDARAVPLLSSLLNDKKQADKGKFNSSSDVESTFMGSHNESNETYIVSYGYDDGEFELDDLYVFPEFQNRGIGTIVIQKCCREVSQTVMLYVFIRNCRAVSLYKKLGFEIVERIKDRRYIMKRRCHEIKEEKNASVI